MNCPVLVLETQRINLLGQDVQQAAQRPFTQMSLVEQIVVVRLFTGKAAQVKQGNLMALVQLIASQLLQFALLFFQGPAAV